MRTLIETGLVSPEMMGILAAVSVFLLFFLYLRWKKLRRDLNAPQSPGHGIETEPLEQQLQRVRANFPGARHSKPRRVSYRRAMIALASRTLGQLDSSEIPV